MRGFRAVIPRTPELLSLYHLPPLAGRMEDLRQPRKYVSDNTFCFVQFLA